MKKKSKDQRWRWMCAGSLLLASLSGNLEASALTLPNVSPMEVSQATKKLRGTVLDTNGTPIIGASISVKGTTTGTISDLNGVFILDVNDNDVLDISFIGYLSHSVKVGSQTDLQVILKDAASAAIYGSRAANGVILVTTKSGKKGKAVVNYDFSIGWQNPWRKMSVLNATEYETIMNESYVNAGMDPLYDDPTKAGVGTNWQDEIYNENAPIMNHQASISGGGDKGSYFLSFGYLDQEGIVGGKDKSDYKRYSIRFNNTYNVFENKTNKFFRSFKVGTNLGYTRISSKGISENDNFSGPLASAVMTPPNESVYLENPSAEDLAYYDFAALLGTSMERYDSKKVKGTALNLRAEDDHKAWIDLTNSASPGDQHSEGGATEHRMASVFGRF